MNLTEWQQTFNLLHTKTWRESPGWQNEPISPSQVRGLNILLRGGMLMANERDDKLFIVSKMIGRVVESTNELTKIEAHVLISILKDDRVSTEKEWVLSEDGHDWIYQAELAYLESAYATEANV